LGVFDLPFLFANEKEADAVLDGPAGKFFNAKLEVFADFVFHSLKYPVRVLTFGLQWKVFFHGESPSGSGKRPVRT
jgi:hypothetical protein